ncbi:hypothetical protein BV378_25090 [Nostoc sp. RF31YmG]|nr:hypothetical protein BV378_25090 [Nostoc sp. RF31YmG]
MDFVSIYGNSVGAGHPDVSRLAAYDYDSGLGLTRIVDHSILQSLNVITPGGVRRAFYAILGEISYLTGQEDIVNLQTLVIKIKWRQRSLAVSFITSNKDKKRSKKVE